MNAKNVFFALSTLTLVVGTPVGTLLTTPAFAGSEYGWDVFNLGSGVRIPTASMEPSVSAGAGKGWDAFATGSGAPIQAMAASQGMAGRHARGAGWDVFRVGTGERLPDTTGFRHLARENARP